MTDKLYSDKFAQRSTAINNLKEELRGLGFRNKFDLINEAVVTPLMKEVLNRLKNAMKTASLKNNDLLLLFVANQKSLLFSFF